MATRSMIGKVSSNGSIRLTYCHWDGNPGHQLSRLAQYDTESKVDALLDLGEMSSLESTLETCVAYERDRHEEPRPALWHTDMKSVTHAARLYDAVFIYLFQEGSWEYASVGRSGTSVFGI